MGIFYEELLLQFDSLPLPIAYGPPNRGKSKAAKLCVAACGNTKGVYTEITLAVCRNLLSQPTPFVYDDPSDPFLLKELLISAFGGSEAGTRHLLDHSRTIPLITANNFIVEKVSQEEERYS
jgi:hypothetical protein